MKLYHGNLTPIKYIIMAAFGISLYFCWWNVCHGAYTDYFIISAYYSPLPDQSRYVTGSYEGDIRLNGSGVNSADGTPVYPGMIAAPSSYPFGTKMKIPGIGVVAVHDRGGAIVHAGERGNSYDRLDVWMGYGDKGLDRALNWGKRTVQVTVYGLDPGIGENVYLEGYSEAEKFIKNIVNQQNIFKDDLWYGESGDKVEELQEYLNELGYYKGTIDGYYGDATYKAVVQFQLDERIIDKDTEFGTGYFGPQTRAKIEAVIDKRRKNKIPRKNLGRDDEGDEVKKLQEALLELGYDLEITEVYDDQTIEAVFKFQKDNDIIDDELEVGAGYFGPKTYTILAKRISDLNTESTQKIEESDIVQAEYLAFYDDLTIGDSGPEVYRLQEELIKLNFLRIEPTGYFGEVTEHALFKFQQKIGILSAKADFGAGVFGPTTKNALNKILGYRANTKAMIAKKSINNTDKKTFVAEKNNEQEKVQKEIGPTLTYGSKASEVYEIQQKLRTLGYFDSAVTTDYFGDKTKEAVISFQLANGIIKNEYDSEAGVFGPKTRSMLERAI